MPRPLPLLPTLVILLPVLLLGGCSRGTDAAPVSSEPAATSAATTEDVGAPAVQRALAAWRTWDAARAAAWRDADPAALARLYRPGAAAGRADVAALRAWSDAGWRVEGLTTRLVAVRRVARAGDGWGLELDAQVAPGAAAIRRDARLPLPRDPLRRRVVVLERVDAGWRAVRLTGVSPRDRPDRSRSPR
ncbi:hypothetical protein K8Z61_03965 [Nocardioides sp. TRM66260-LWL]|uniref:hypothetical protein n=1 Tax=Nocardioides sp. TRM66260-LWL TaxID=2874478 RepID=UPI001CC72FA4|nr:hypothetical protein [Nocardioides sp. TRM66260-LWL]MBZ5733643.1 hypothetical protein [Nocardioides sp. TRM66260-LWL]